VTNYTCFIKLEENAAFFLDHISVMKQKDYILEDEYILKIRNATTQITETKFTSKAGTFKVTYIKNQGFSIKLE